MRLLCSSLGSAAGARSAARSQPEMPCAIWWRVGTNGVTIGDVRRFPPLMIVIRYMRSSIHPPAPAGTLSLRSLSIPALVALALGAASCGDSAGSASSPSDLASKSADEIMSDVTSALADVRSYHVEGTRVDKDGRSRLKADVRASGSMRLTLVVGRERASMIVVGGDMFLKGSHEYWLAHDSSGRAAALFSGRWLKLPAAVAAKSRSKLRYLLPDKLARCLDEGHGTLTKKGTERLGNRRVVVISDKGNIRGGSPGDLYVSAVGSPLPLRAVQTGPERRGRSGGPCGNDSSRSTESELRFSRYNEPLRIAAPPSHLDLGRLAAAAARQA